MAEAYIAAAVRTAGGRHSGKLADWRPASAPGTPLDRQRAKRRGLQTLCDGGGRANLTLIERR